MDKYSLWNLVCGYLFILKMHYFPSLWWGSRAFHIQLGWIIVQVYNPDQGQIMSPTLWYNIVQRELDLLDIPLWHWSTILMIPYQSILGRRTWQVLWMPWWYTWAPESGRKKNKIIKNPCSWGWVFRNPLVCKITSSKVNDMLFYLLASITKKQAQHLTSPLWFWRQHLPYLVFLFWFIHWVTQKSIHFEKNWEQERILKQSEAVIPDTSSSPA